MADVDVDRLSIEISARSSDATKNIGELAESVGSLHAAVKGVASPLSKFAATLRELASVGDLSNVTGALGSLSKLSGLKFSKENGRNISELARSLSEVSAQSGDISSIGSMARGLSALSGFKFSKENATNVAALAQAAGTVSATAGINLAQVAKAANMFSNVKVGSGIGNQITRIAAALKSVQSTNLDVEHVRGIVSTMRMFGEIPKSGLSATVNALARLPKVMREIHNVDFGQIAKDCKRLAEALGPLPAQLQNIAVGWNVVNKALRVANTEAAKGTTIFGKLQGVMGKVRAVGSFVAAFKMVKDTIMNFVDEANQYVEDMNLFNVAMGSAKDSAYEFAQQVNDIMGINIQDWARGQGTFMTMAKGMGIASDQSALMSQQLTQLSYDLASFYNISESDAMEKVQAGLAGQLRPLRELGYDLSQARMKEDALRWGITKKVSTMTQAEKAMLRYRMMLEQVSWAQGDMSRTLQSPANMLRVLAAEARNTAVAFGKVFLPIIQRIAPVAIAVMRVLGKLANMIAALTGGQQIASVDYSGVDSMGVDDEYAEDVSDGLGGVADSAEDATDAVRELKNEVAGFDELNILPAHDTSGKSGNGGSDAGDVDGDGGFGSFELPTYDFIGDASNMADAIVDAIMSMVDRCMALLKPFFDYFASMFEAMKLQAMGLPLAEALGNVVANAIGLLSTFLIEATGILGALWIAFNVPATVTQAVNTLAGLFNMLQGAVEFCGEMVRGFTDTALVPLAAWLGDKIREGLEFALELFLSWGQWFRDNAENAYRFGENVGTVVGIVADLAMAIADLGLAVLAELIKNVSDAVQWLLQAFLDLPDGVQMAITAFALWKGATKMAKVGIDDVIAVIARLTGKSAADLTDAFLNMKIKATDMAKVMTGTTEPSLSAFAGTVTGLPSNLKMLAEWLGFVGKEAVAGGAAAAEGAVGVEAVGAAAAGAAEGAAVAAEGIGSLVAEIATGIGIIAAIATVIHAVRGKFDEWRENLKGSTGIVGLLGSLVTIVSYVVDILDNLIVGVVGVVKGFADWIMECTPLGSVLKLIGDLIGGLFGFVADITQGFKDFGDMLLGTSDAEKEAEAATAEHEAALDELNQRMEEEAQRIEETQGKIDEYTESHHLLRDAMDRANMSSEELATVLEDQGLTFEDLQQKVTDYIDSTTNGFDRLSEKSTKTFEEMAEALAQNLEDMRLWSEDLLVVEERWGEDFRSYIEDELGPEYARALKEELDDPSSANLQSMYDSWEQMQKDANDSVLKEQKEHGEETNYETKTQKEQQLAEVQVANDKMVAEEKATQDEITGVVRSAGDTNVQVTTASMGTMTNLVESEGSKQVSAANRNANNIVGAYDIAGGISGNTRTAMQALDEEVYYGGAVAARTAESIAGDISSAFDIDTHSDGWNVIVGLNNGMCDAASSFLYNTVNSISNNVTSGLRNAFGINSPSRVMRDMIGVFIPAGVGEGVQKGAPALYDSIKTLAGGAGTYMERELNMSLSMAQTSLPSLGVKASVGQFVDGTVKLDIDADAITNAVADGFVMGAASVAATNGSDGTGGEMVVLMDGREVARAALPHMADMARTGEWKFGL